LIKRGNKLVIQNEEVLDCGSVYGWSDNNKFTVRRMMLEKGGWWWEDGGEWWRGTSTKFVL